MALLQKALSTNVQENIMATYSSRVYQQILSSGKIKNDEVVQNLLIGYQEASYYLGLSLRALGNEATAQPFLERGRPPSQGNDVVLRIF